MRSLQAVIIAASAAFLLLVLVTFRAPGVRAGLPRPAPEFRLATLSGRSLSLGELKGRVVLVNFWATWCPPCVEETPGLVGLHRDFGARGLELVGVSVDEDPLVLESFIQRFGIRYHVLRDPTSSTPRRYGTFKYPETFLVDATGQIVRRWVGIVDWDRADVRADIEGFLVPPAASQR